MRRNSFLMKVDPPEDGSKVLRRSHFRFGESGSFVKEKLEAHVSGSGDVLYIGSPDVETHISGSGKVKRRD